jgi:hypothetical protein
MMSSFNSVFYCLSVLTVAALVAAQGNVTSAPATMRAPAPAFAALGAGVSPILECWIGKNHRWVAVWSYSSDTSVDVPVGDPNNVIKLVTTPKLTDYPDQPTSFTSGYHRYVFSTSFPYFLKPIGGGLADEASWAVNGKVTKTYLDERPYQCLDSKFKIHVNSPGAGTQAALKTSVASELQVNENRVVIANIGTENGATVFEINFVKDPAFNYDVDFDTDPTITDPDVWPPETEPIDPMELLVKFSRAADLNPNLVSAMVSSAGGTYAPMYTSQNPMLRTQSSGVEISSFLYPKDPTTPQGPIGNPPGPPAVGAVVIANIGVIALSIILSAGVL